MPISRAVRITRQAISPRLAMSIFLNMQRTYSGILSCFSGIFELLAAQQGQRAGNPSACIMRLNNLVNVTALGGDKRIEELFLIFLRAPFNLFVIAQSITENNLHRALGTHHGNFRRRPA